MMIAKNSELLRYMLYATDDDKIKVGLINGNDLTDILSKRYRLRLLKSLSNKK